MNSLIKSKLLFNYLKVFSLNCRLSQSLRRYSTNDNKSTLNLDEMNKFRSFKDIDWWTDRWFSPLRHMNELRVPFIRDAYNPPLNTSKPLDGIKLLDIGCGPGILSEPLARLGANVTAIDPIEENIEMAINHAKRDKQLTDNLNYECVSIEELSNRDQMNEYFDGVIASEVVEHIDNIDLFLSSSLKCLKKGGNVFITTMNQTPIALFAGILVAEYVLQLVPKGTHHYNQFVCPQALSLVLKDRKFGPNYI